MYEALLSQLLSGQRAPSEVLSIDGLCRELDVSQTPIREALARLEHTGLVRREALRGYRVADALTDGEVAKLLDARIVLEPALTREAGLRVTPEFLDELQSTVDDLDEVAESADIESIGFEHYWNSDYAFHRKLAAQSDNMFLEQAFVALDGPMQRFRLFTKRGRTGVTHAAADHREILDALGRRDADGAAGLMHSHLIAAKSRVLSVPSSR